MSIKNFILLLRRNPLSRIVNHIVPLPIRTCLLHLILPSAKWLLMDPAKMDEHLLEMVITKHTSTLNVATKRKLSIIRSIEYSQYKTTLERALEICRTRNKKGDHISWAEQVLEKYKIMEKNKEKIDLRKPSTDRYYQTNDLFSLIKGRRSIRYFQPRGIEKEKIERILEAGIWAPCSGNRQAWHFVVQQTVKIEDSAGLRKEPNNLEYQPLPYGAVLIYVAIDERIYPLKYAPAMDASAAIQNMLLMIHHLGLGACWHYGGENLNQAKLRNKFRLSEYYYFFSIIHLGYPAEAPEAPGRKPLSEITTFIGFDEKEGNQERSLRGKKVLQ